VAENLQSRLLSTTQAAWHTSEIGGFHSNNFRARSLMHIFITVTGKPFTIARMQMVQKMASCRKRLDALHGCCGDLLTSP
jgi:hypothetical protein